MTSGLTAEDIETLLLEENNDFEKTVMILVRFNYDTSVYFPSCFDDSQQFS